MSKEYPIAVFGHGKISVCTTQDTDSGTINGVAFLQNDDYVPIGDPREGDIGKSLDEVNTIVQLRFERVESIDIVIEALEKVKKAMQEGDQE